MTREILLGIDKPEPIEDQQARESDIPEKERGFQRNIVDHLRTFGLLNTWEEIEQEMRNFLAMVDFTELHDIFADLAAKSHGKQVPINFIGPDRIIPSFTLISLGRYTPQTNIIELHTCIDERWDENCQYYKEDNERDLGPRKEQLKADISKVGTKELFLLMTLVHEEAHAVSKNICIGASEDLAIGRVIYGQIGYQRIFQPKNTDDLDRAITEGKPTTLEGLPVPGSFFKSFNEGVTQMVTQKIMLEYLRRKGWAQPEVSDLKMKLEMEPGLAGISGYKQEMDFVQAIIVTIAHHAGLAVEQVWQSILEGYFKGRGFAEDEDTSDFFKEEFGEDIIGLIAEKKFA